MAHETQQENPGLYVTRREFAKANADIRGEIQEERIERAREDAQIGEQLKQIINLMSNIAAYGVDPFVDHPAQLVSVSYAYTRATGKTQLGTLTLRTDQLYRGGIGLITEVIDRLVDPDDRKNDLLNLTQSDLNSIQLLPGALRLPPSAEDTAWDSTDLRVQNWIEEKLLELEKE